MKKIVSILLALIMSFIVSVPAFASSAAVGEIAETVISLIKGECDNYNDFISKRTTAARWFYFYFMLNDGWNCPSNITANKFDNSGIRFSDEFLQYYFDVYVTHIGNLSGSYFYTAPYLMSEGDIFIQAIGDSSPFDLNMLGYIMPYASSSDFFVMSESNMYYGYMQNDFDVRFTFSIFNNFKNDSNTMLARYLLENGEDAVDPNPGKSGLEIAPAYISSDEFIEGLEIDNTLYFPRNDYRVVSYRNDPTFQRLVKDGKAMSNQSYEPTIIYEGGYLVNKNSPALYFVLFYYDDDIKGYGMYQYKFYIAEEVNEDGSIKKVPHLMRWNCFDETEAEAVEVDFSVQNGMPNFSETCTFKYVRLGFDSSNLIFKCYDTYADYMNNSSNYCYFKASSGNQEYFKCYTTDLSSIFGFFQYCYGNRNHYFMGSLDKHAESCTFKADDVGLITSTEPILLKSYPFDSSKIGKGQIVTINGDTIYNYTITNPETGDSSKFGDYITNNYTYITNNNGGDSSGTGGKVEVGGKIDVGGSVGVDITVSVPDININVNGSGGEGTSLSPSDFTSGDTVDTNKYFDSALEMSENTQNFFGDFFAFLPPEILALILFGLTMAIVCRVGGR